MADEQVDMFGAEKSAAIASRQSKFEIFWSSYPRRIAKGKAREAFEKAIKKTTLDNMLKAITEYVAKKPEKTDYKYPATWLNGECWDDEWEPQQSRAQFPSRAKNFQTREEYLRAELARAERSFSR